MVSVEFDEKRNGRLDGTGTAGFETPEDFLEPGGDVDRFLDNRILGLFPGSGFR